MRLNQLRISGFKSFPERAEMAFDTGVTAIVGPNGCGKSNLIDAITWALGEQSVRNLRGERMEDVIFSGSDGRRPTSTAEVRLRFSAVAASAPPPDGESNGGAPSNGSNGSPVEAVPIVRDVEVGRRLFRSGESEYLLDGHVCRLRDIQDLLMDSGVGVKAYAVVEQGKIGQILGARPAERRQLIEEAAGVTKYKSRRRAAELKIEAARQNLTRVDDIIFEIDQQRGTLKRQAARARRYRQLREDLRRWQKVELARAAAAAEQTIETTAERLEAARVHEHGAAARVAELETAHEGGRIALAEAERAVVAAREAAHAHELEAGRLQQQIEFETKQAGQLASRAAALEAQRAALETQRSSLDPELARQVESVHRCVAEQAATAARLQDTKAAHAAAVDRIEGVEADLEAARSASGDAASAIATLQNAIQNAADARDRSDADVSRLAVEAAELAAEATRLAAQGDTVAAAARQAQAALDGVRAARTDCEARLAAETAARDALQGEVRSHEKALAAATARVGSLEELIAAREGYGDAARLLLTDPDSPAEHLGAVADHLQVDREHELVVEAGFGDLLHALVVQRIEDARSGMEFVAARGSGRCGFILAASVPAPTAPPAPSGDDLVPFTRLARATGAGAAAVERLLARRWLAPTFEAAEAAARASGATVVAPDGTVFHGDHLVDGGGGAQQRGVLRIRGELEEARARQASEQTAAEQLSRQHTARAAAAAAAADELQALQADEHAHEKQLLEAELGLARCNEEQARLQQRRDLVASEDRRAREQRETQVSRQAAAQEDLARRTAERQASEQRIAEVRDLLTAARAALQDLNVELSAAKVAHAELTERATGLQADAERIRTAAAELDGRVQACVADREQAVEQREALEISVTEAGRRVDAEVRQLDARRADVQDLDARTTALRESITAQGQVLQAARRELEQCRAKASEIDVAMARAEAERDALAASCRDTFQVGVDEVRDEVERLERDGVLAQDVQRLAAAEPDAPEPAQVPSEPAPAPDRADGDAHGASAATIIATLGARIERLGAVNMMAIEQFGELEQRHEFLTAQRQDLLDAIETTGRAIERIDTTTRTRFKQAFEAVDEHFQGTFSTLFGGGGARLVLLDETDLLESGIDIVAQPPGKRLQSVQLLSGGEKALTAMALMFAVFKYRPSPFCLLDEIDAPLDDANIGRFVDVLRGMQEQTQFVLVTHNRKTMEIADRLYGVTMEEPGVSKLISVWLN